MAQSTASRGRRRGWREIGLIVVTLLIGTVGLTACGATTSSADSSSASTPSPTPTPETTFETVTEEVAIPFAATVVDDPLRDQGTTALVTAGVNGVKVITYKVTLVDGVEVLREAVSEAVQTAPVDEVTAIGSKAPAPVAAPVPLVQQGGGGCDPNYTGACVPIASDVDCAGGSGNGPAYVQGPVRIVGSDIYDLDRDGDGIACD